MEKSRIRNRTPSLLAEDEESRDKDRGVRTRQRLNKVESRVPPTPSSVLQVPHVSPRGIHAQERELFLKFAKGPGYVFAAKYPEREVP